MEKILVAVGSTRRPKVNAVTEALASIRNLFENSPEFEVVGVEVASGVRHTPLTREDLMAGARQRAEALARVAREGATRVEIFCGAGRRVRCDSGIGCDAESGRGAGIGCGARGAAALGVSGELGVCGG